jgi:hypothetical protein
MRLYSRIGVRGEGTNIAKDDILHLPHDTRFCQDPYKI